MRQNRKVTVRVTGAPQDAYTVLLILAKDLAVHGIKYTSQLPSAADRSRNMAEVQQSIQDMVDSGIHVELIQE